MSLSAHLSDMPQTPTQPTRDLSGTYGAGASGYELDALQAWKQQWDAAAAAAKARDWTETIILLEKCVLMRPDFAKGYMTLSRVYGQAAGGDPSARAAALRRGLKACAAQGEASRPLLQELRRVEPASAEVAVAGAEAPEPSAEETVAGVQAARDEAAGACAETPPPEVQRQSSLPRVAADSLSAAGFERRGWAWVHPRTGTLVIEAADEGAPPEVYNSSLRQADIDAFVALTFGGAWDADTGARLARWVEDAIVLDAAAGPEGPEGAAAAAAALAEDEAAVDVGLSRLPTAEALGASSGRALRLYTWGDKVVSQHALERECDCHRHFNAKPLNGRGGGADLKRNATQDARIVRNVCASMAGGEGLEWLRRVVRAIEAEDLHCASVFCSQGRHRSVSAALILRSRYYPNAEFVPLNMR